MATGDATDLLSRVKALIPFRWFSYRAPFRDAIIGGLSDSASWCYSWLTFAKQQSRLATSTGLFLDLFAYDFLGRHLRRKILGDDAFRARIRSAILQERVTRAGMSNAVKQLTGTAPIIFEPWNTGDTWAIGSGWAFDANGAFGSLQLPAQAFVTATRPAIQGIPAVSGFGDYNGGIGIGSFALVSLLEITGDVTDDDIYDVVNTTRPTGVIAWTAIISGGFTVPHNSLIFDDTDNSQYLGIF